MQNTVVGLFESPDRAHAAFGALIERGVDRNEISLIANETSEGYFRALEGTNDRELDDATEGAEKGASTGAMIGGSAGLLLGLGALFIPGIGAALALGPLAALITGAGIGTVTGGMIGGLSNAGVPEEHAHYFAEGVRRGGTLLAVHVNVEETDDVENILREQGAVDITERARAWRDGGWPGTITPL